MKEHPAVNIVIRPSSKGADRVALTWRVYEDRIQHLEAACTGPTSYKVDDVQYDDLDEVLARHIEPLRTFTEAIRTYSKFFTGDYPQIGMRNP